MAALRADDVDNHRPAPSQEKILVLAFQAGDRSAYQAIYRHYFPRVLKLCRRMLHNREDAQEAAQETFLRVYQTLGRFNGKYRLGAWINRIGTNVCLDHLRARTRRPYDAAVEMAEIEGPGSLADHDPASLYLRRVEGHKVLKVLGELPPMHRAAIVLRAFEGMSYGEIAGTLSLTEGQVKALLHRARKSFKRSWRSSVASVLLPARLLRRLHRIPSRVDESTGQSGAPSVHHAAEIATNTVHVAGSWSSLIQQCAESISARVAPILTAVMVTATAGAAVSPAYLTNTPEPEGDVVEAQPEVSGHDAQAFRPLGHTRTVVGRTPEGETEVVSGAQSTPEAGASSSVDPPTDTDTTDGGEVPEESDTGDTDLGQVPDESDTEDADDPPQPPAPAPFTVALGFETEAPILPAAPTSYHNSVDCANLIVNQQVALRLVDGPQSYPAELTVNAGQSFDFKVHFTRSHVSVDYLGAGVMMSSVEEGDSLQLNYTGLYASSQPLPRSLKLPSSGQFSSQLTLDCATSSVVTENLQLGT